jgi:phosphate transport system protein
MRTSGYVTRFAEGLEQLRGKLLEMSALVESGILRSIHAVVHKDRAAAQEVFKIEARVNSIELEIDALAVELLALHQPMASNLRFIIAALKINTDLERMGDLSVNVAQSALALIDTPPSAAVIDIPYVAGLVQSMVRKSMSAFLASDIALADDVLASDPAVDEFRTACYHQLTALMQSDHASIRPTLSLLNVIRALERLADHATNIAEDAMFYVKGVDARRSSPSPTPYGS